MRSGLGVSILLHVLVIAIGYFGLPLVSRDVMMETPVMVDLVTVSDVTNAPTPEVKKKPAPAPKKKVEAPKPVPKPKPPVRQVKVATPPPPPPPPVPEPKPEAVVVPPPPQPKLQAKTKPEPKPKPKPKIKPKPKQPQASKVLAHARPVRKPKPPKPVDAFASVLKTIEQLKVQPQARAKPEKQPKKKHDKPKETFDQLIAKALVSKKQSFDSSRPLSISEIDLVRQQIGQCWSLPAGAKGAENMNIEIAVNMNPDGTVRDARINNKGLATDPFLRTMAESALRAVLNRRCQPFKLPREKYDRWQTMTLIFNPKEMFGG